MDCANNIIDQAKQPQEYLIASLRKKEIQLKQQKNFIETLEKQVKYVWHSNTFAILMTKWFNFFDTI